MHSAGKERRVSGFLIRGSVGGERGKFTVAIEDVEGVYYHVCKGRALPLIIE